LPEDLSTHKAIHPETQRRGACKLFRSYDTTTHHFPACLLEEHPSTIAKTSRTKEAENFVATIAKSFVVFAFTN
jgi:hypothetical protein